jgi:hypothetical protein
MKYLLGTKMQATQRGMRRQTWRKMAYFHLQYQQPPGQSKGLQHEDRSHSTPLHVTESTPQHVSVTGKMSR